MVPTIGITKSNVAGVTAASVAVPLITSAPEALRIRPGVASVAATSLRICSRLPAVRRFSTTLF